MTAAGTFTGFGAGAVEWFAGLERDNSRAYMAGTREVFETQVREPMVALLTELAGERGGEVKLFRQHRDVRFAKDRSPYKITTYGVLVGRPGTAAGLYAELSSAGLYAGSGYHDMAPDQLARFRVGVDSPAGELLSRVVDGLAGSLSLSGEALRGVPRGYRRDHPRVVLLRRTALV
ncbi:MAG: DUF2461 family protein, partial [Pseudonocardia sp.]|nr:DUF2461 family protein [Pseudonocardia sp.]